jgi:cytochrome P450
MTPPDPGARRIGTTETDEARNRSFGIGLVEDVYPVYAELREQGPACPGSIAGHFPVPAPAAASGVTAAVYSHELASQLLKDHEAYSSHFYAILDRAIGPSLIGMDEPDHRRMRALLQGAFSKNEMAWWATDIIQPVVDEHLGAIAHRGYGDLYGEVGAKVPIHTTVAVLGLDESDRQWFFDQAVLMTSNTAGGEAAVAAAAISDYIAPLVAERRRSPGRDLISVLTAARISAADSAQGVDARPLTDQEINTFVRLLVIAGASTTFRAYANMMFALLTHPDQFQRVVADRSLGDAAVEESLRWEQPLSSLGRLATRDITLGGLPVRAGETVEACIGAANHDPAQWPDPDRFDISRPRVDRHLTFGWGVHRCLGVHLARTELRILLDRTIELLPGLRLDPAYPVPAVSGLGFRVASPLHVLFTPRSER